jgi:hypothetical protein
VPENRRKTKKEKNMQTGNQVEREEVLESELSIGQKTAVENSGELNGEEADQIAGGLIALL